ATLTAGLESEDAVQHQFDVPKSPARKQQQLDLALVGMEPDGLEPDPSRQIDAGDRLRKDLIADAGGRSVGADLPVHADVGGQVVDRHPHDASGEVRLSLRPVDAALAAGPGPDPAHAHCSGSRNAGGLAEQAVAIDLVRAGG